jgi:ribosomal protein L22
VTKKSHPLIVLATQFGTETRAQWAALCDIACSIEGARVDKAAKFLAERASKEKAGIKRKMEAIQFLATTGLTVDAIKAIGESKTLSQFTKAKKSERTEDLVMMKFYVSSSLKERVTEEFWRLKKLLKIKTSDDAFEFVLSLLAVPDAETLHNAGMIDARKKSKARR